MWHTVLGEKFRVGISQAGVEQAGKIVFIDLPEKGAKIEKGGELATIESTKAAVDLYSPVGGTVVAVNTNVTSNPDLLNTKPEGDGWLVELASEN
ncbi:MAG: Glycine cleavage system H protein [Chlamydiia bacterium]|nr:Glycine cleavage system H protein [Chlamydiia bacterium]